MVLWTKGLYSRFLRLIGVSVMLCCGVGLLLFFMLFSGGRWPGQAATSLPGAPTLTQTYIAGLPTMPVILQNPRVPTATPTPVPTASRQMAPVSSSTIDHHAVPATANRGERIHTVIPSAKKLEPERPAPMVNPAPLLEPDPNDPFAALRNLLPPWFLPDTDNNQFIGNTGKLFTASVNANTHPSASTNTLWVLSSVAVLLLLFCLALLAARRRRLGN